MKRNSEQQTVFVVEDDEAMRDSIRWLLESENIETRMYASAGDFLKGCDFDLHGCLLLDVRMPEMSGMELLEVLRSKGFQLPVIMITGHGDVPMAVRAIKLGAFNFIQKPFASQELLDQIQLAFAKDRESRQKAGLAEQRRAYLASLTDRQMQVMELVAAGDSSKAIAMKLGISPKTVDIHRATIMRKLGVKSVAEIVQLRLSLH
ncbi:MAG TPA: response regulator [Gallionella sp.]|nr:response regulator [Gallionella sp.]